MRDTALLLAGAAAALFALLMLVQRTLYGSAVCLLVVLLQAAAMFYLLGAPLLGFLQVMIYAGAIMVMIVVAIMATPPRLRALWSESALPRPAALLLLAAVTLEFLSLGLPASTSLSVNSVEALPPWPGLELELAAALFGPFALYTEALGILVFLAALAVVETWRETRG